MVAGLQIIKCSFTIMDFPQHPLPRFFHKKRGRKRGKKEVERRREEEKNKFLLFIAKTQITSPQHSKISFEIADSIGYEPQSC